MDLAWFRMFVRSALVLALILPLGALPSGGSAAPARSSSPRPVPAATRPPALTVSPSSLSRSFVFGSAALTDTLALTLTNVAASDLRYLLEERPGGFANRGGPQILLVSRMAASANTAAATALTNLGYAFEAIANTVFETRPISELLAYDAIVYIGNTGTSANSPSNLKLIDYLDAGGRLLIADNNLGFNNSESIFYQTYLDATYGGNNPDPIGHNAALVGADIMGGLDTSSADPEPDFFTTGPDSVRIFRYAVDQSIGGSRISRGNYRAVYIATDYNFLGTSVIGDPIETTIMARSLNWLIGGVEPDVVDWLAETPTQGDIPAGESRNVAVGWHPERVDQPGTYTGTLRFEHTLAPTDTIDVPVTMIVTPSPSQAEITGVLTSTGICDSAPAPLVGATVLISATGGFSATVSSDQNGRYRYYVPAAGTYDLTVIAEEHQPLAVSVSAVAGSTTVRDLTLRLHRSCVAAGPPDLAVSLPLGSQITATLAITSSGAAPLDYQILETTGSTAPNSDAYGYVWTTQPAAWIDTSGGTELNLGDDAVWDHLIGFPFPFYDRSSDQMLIGNNGGIIVGVADGAVSFANLPLNAFNTPNYLIAPFWDDIAATAGAVRLREVGSAPDRAFVVEWAGRAHVGTVGTATFQAALFENGNILFQYQDVVFGNPEFDYGASATVGLRGPGAAVTMPYSFDQPGLADGQAICFVRPGNAACGDVPWLRVSPSAATGAGGTPPSSRQAGVGLDAAAVPLSGSYTATLAIVHNAPQPVLLIPVRMTVGLPANYGTVEGVVSGLRPCDGPALPLPGASVVIGATEPVTLTADAAGHYVRDLPAGTYQMTVSHPGYQTATLGVTVTAQATVAAPVALRRLAPCQSFGPASFSGVQANAEAVTMTLAITNTGLAPLDWRLLKEPIAPKCSPDGIDWLIIPVTSGSVAPGAAILAEVVLDGRRVPEPGVYEGGLCLESNDLLSSSSSIPVTLTVEDPPARRNHLPLLLR